MTRYYLHLVFWKLARAWRWIWRGYGDDISACPRIILFFFSLAGLLIFGQVPANLWLTDATWDQSGQIIAFNWKWWWWEAFVAGPLFISAIVGLVKLGFMLYDYGDSFANEPKKPVSIPKEIKLAKEGALSEAHLGVRGSLSNSE